MQSFSRFLIPQQKLPRFAYMGRYMLNLKTNEMVSLLFSLCFEHVTDHNRKILRRERIERKEKAK